MTSKLVSFDRLAHDFSPGPKAVLQSEQTCVNEPGAPNLLRLTHTAEPPRQQLLRGINRTPGGSSSIAAMRRALLAQLARQPVRQAVEADWNFPAQLLAQIFRHEAVHQIDGWDDRRCFAFFYPQLPNKPLIFVDVALLPEMPQLRTHCTLSPSLGLAARVRRARA